MQYNNYKLDYLSCFFNNQPNANDYQKVNTFNDLK